MYCSKYNDRCCFIRHARACSHFVHIAVLPELQTFCCDERGFNYIPKLLVNLADQPRELHTMIWLEWSLLKCLLCSWRSIYQYSALRSHYYCCFISRWRNWVFNCNAQISSNHQVSISCALKEWSELNGQERFFFGLDFLQKCKPFRSRSDRSKRADIVDVDVIFRLMFWREQSLSWSKKNIYDISNISYVDCRGIWLKIRRFYFWLRGTNLPLPPSRWYGSLITFGVINSTEIPV